MSVRRNKKQERILDGIADATWGEVGVVLTGLAIVFTLPWTIFRLARVAWHIEYKQGQTDHHKRIVGILVGYLIFWTIGLVLAALGIWGLWPTTQS